MGQKAAIHRPGKQINAEDEKAKACHPRGNRQEGVGSREESNYIHTLNALYPGSKHPLCDSSHLPA